jgi:hypothetical protein
MVKDGKKSKVSTPKQKRLKIFHQNIRGLRPKYNEILCHLEDQTPQVLCFTEHHLRKEEIAHLNLDNYILSAYYCRKLYKNGGTCIYIHESLNSESINLDKYCHDKEIEACAITLYTTIGKISIITIYRAPDSNYKLFLDNVEQILQKICKINDNVIMCGDFNVDYMSNCSKKDKLEEILSSFNLKSIISFPTRIGYCSTTTRIIDNIFINELLFTDYEVISISNGLSDHEAQLLSIPLPTSGIKQKDVSLRRKINEINMIDFKIKLSYEEWDSVFNNKDFNTSFKQFLNILLRYFYASFHLIKCQKTRQKPWTTTGIKISCINKRLLYAEMKKNTNPSNCTYYKNYCKILARVIIAAKKMAYDHQIKHSNNKVKTTWKIINSEILKKGKKGNMGTSNIPITKDSAEIFNKHFSEVADKIHKKIKEDNPKDSDYLTDSMIFMTEAFKSSFPTIKFTKTTNREIERIIGSLKSSYTHGYDEISNNILKACRNFISVPLSYLCNRMLFEGVFPERLKYAEIIPIYKKGDKNKVVNYRPISILTSINKIFEKVIYSRLIKHFNENSILSKHQYGFRANLGTENAIFRLISEILSSLNQKRQISGIFCDLEKAFDCISHEVLLKKLKFYGIRDKQYDLIKSYLTNRKQRTVLKGIDNVKIYSDWEGPTNGVPQGSILGPLLFVIFINDLPKILENWSVPILFADDTSVLISHVNPIQLKNTMHNVYRTLDNWFKSNMLSLNSSKTNYINFTIKNPIEKGMEEIDSIITSTMQTNFLGLGIKHDMTWDKHIDEIINKLRTASYMIRNVKQLVSMKALISVYYSYFHSTMTYGIIFWGNSTQAERVFKIQKRVIRIIKGCGMWESCREHFREMKILPLRSQYIFSLMMFAVKNKDLFNINRDCHQINTRQHMNMHMSQVNFSKYGNGVCHMAVKIYNGLPKNLKVITNHIKKFKIGIKEFLTSNAFYTVQEFIGGKDVILNRIR